VVSINILDNADEFRIEIVGHFSGGVVDDVRYTWTAVVVENLARRITVDITQMDGYDLDGCGLLREMDRHGTRIAAGSALSLVFLHEISGPERLRPALVRKAPGAPQVMPFRRPRPAASGE
jgi:hypothetical protein